MSEGKENLTIVLLGSEQCGKSSTANTIVGFDSNKYTKSEALLFEKKFQEDENYKWHIFDTPSYWGPDKWNKEGGIEETCNDLNRLMNHLYNSYKAGITVFLLVFNITNRYTINDLKRVETFEKMFGEEEFWKRCIIVFTKGDIFEGDFGEWVEENENEFAKLIEKCNKRLVLLSNRKKSDMYESSRDELLSKIKILKNATKSFYSLSHFRGQQHARNTLIVKSEMAKIDKEYYEKEAERKRNTASEKDKRLCLYQIMAERSELSKKDRETYMLKKYLQSLENEENLLKNGARYPSCSVL